MPLNLLTPGSVLGSAIRSRSGTGGGGGVPPLDGEVTSAAQIVSTVSNSANAGKSYYMRGGNYGGVNISGSPGPRPSSLITFITYPGEQVTFQGLVFGGNANIRFDGNSANFARSVAGQSVTSGSYGLLLVGDGTQVTPAGTCVYFARNSDTSHYTENIQIANARIGDTPNATFSNWRWQHGIVINTGTRDTLFEDCEIAYNGNDGGISGDITSGGFGFVWQYGSGGENLLTGNHTIRRCHIHHNMNDSFQTGGAQPTGDPTAKLLVDTCLIENQIGFGSNHCDCIQQQSSQLQQWQDTVFRSSSQFLMTGGVGSTRTFSNVYIAAVGNAFNFPGGSPAASGPEDDYIFQNCTIVPPLRLDNPHGASSTASNKLHNCLYAGFSAADGTIAGNCFANDGQANKVMNGAAGLSGDVSGTPTLSSAGEPTDSTTQGWRVPVGYPWTL